MIPFSNTWLPYLLALVAAAAVSIAFFFYLHFKPTQSFCISCSHTQAFVYFNGNKPSISTLLRVGCIVVVQPPCYERERKRGLMKIIIMLIETRVEPGPPCHTHHETLRWVNHQLLGLLRCIACVKSNSSQFAP